MSHMVSPDLSCSLFLGFGVSSREFRDNLFDSKLVSTNYCSRLSLEGHQTPQPSSNTYGGFYFMYDHGKHRNTKRYNVGCNLLGGRHNKYIPKSYRLANTHSLHNFITQKHWNPTLERTEQQHPPTIRYQSSSYCLADET